VSKGTVIFLTATLALIILSVWAIPRVKRALVGESFLVTIKPTMVIEDPEVLDEKNDPVPKTVASLEIYFPMGSAPEKISELHVFGDDGRDVGVIWPEPDREDLPDQGKTRWIIKEAFFPPGFRQGTLRNKARDLTQIRLPNPPFNSAQ
jgi:hypothetical protein